MRFPGDHHFCFERGSIQKENNRVTLPRIHPEIKPDGKILWVCATPTSISSKDTEGAVSRSGGGSDKEHQRVIITPILLSPAPEHVKRANGVSQTGSIKMPDYYTITPVQTASVQSNYATTVPKSFFDDYEGKTKYGRRQTSLFDYGDEVYFVKSPILWDAGKSFYMLDNRGYQSLLTKGRETGDDFIPDGGEKGYMEHLYKLDQGEVLDITNDEVVEVNEAIEVLDTQAKSINLNQSRTYYIGVDDSGEVVMCNIIA